MAVTMEYAWARIAGQKAQIVKAGRLGSEFEKATLTFVTPGCQCELYHVPAKQIMGKYRVSAHFSRKPGQEHDRSKGCAFPNQDDYDPVEVKRANRLAAFFDPAAAGRILYLNSGHEHEFSLHQSFRAAASRASGGHMTYKQSPHDRTFSIKTAADIRRLGQYLDYTNDVYDYIRVIASGYNLPFRRFFPPSHAQAFKTVYGNEKRHMKHPVVLQARPLVEKLRGGPVDKSWKLPCFQERVSSQKNSAVSYGIEPVIVSHSREVIEKASESGTHIIWPSSSWIDFRKSSAMIREAEASGSTENILTLYCRVDEPSQLASYHDAFTR